MKYHTKRKVVDSPSLLRFVKSSGKENPNWSQKYDQNQTQSHSVPEPIQSHCASHSIRKYSPLQDQEAQDILAHRLQISATISHLKVLRLRVWISSHQSFVWSKVFPLDQWKSKKLIEREDNHASEKKGKIHFFAENWKWVFYMSYKVSVSETDIFPVTTNVFACSYDQNWFLRKKLKFMCWLGPALGPRSEMFLRCLEHERIMFGMFSICFKST